MYEQILNFISIKRQVSMITILRFVRLFGIGMFLIIMSFELVQAQGQEWRRIGPWGGNITDIKVKLINDSLLRVGATHQDSIVVASYGAGIFIADSSGGLATPTTPPGNPKWIARNSGLPSLKILCLASGKVGTGDSMYVGLDGNGIYKTTNAGLTWEPAFSLGNAMGTRVVNKIAVNPKEFAIAYAATTQGLWKTTDLGTTWTELKPSGGNGGASWKSVAVNEYETSKVYATPTTGGRVHRSTDDGTTWNNYLVVDGSAQITAMALTCSALDTIYIGCNDGKVKEVTFTTNGNTTSGIVVNKSTGLVANNIITNIAIIPTYAVGGKAVSHDTIYVTTRDGVFKSNNKGNTWMQVNVNLTNTDASVVAVHPVRSGVFPGPAEVGDPTQPYVTLYHNVFVGTTRGGLFATTTNSIGGAVSWTKVDDSLPVGGLRAVSVTPTNSEVVYAGGGYYVNGRATGALYKTTNASSGNATWKIIYPPDTDQNGLYVMSIATDWEDKGYVLVADSIKGIIRSTNAGETWTVVSNTTNAAYVYINRMNSDTMFAARATGTNSYRVIRSVNAGATFITLTQAFNYPITSIAMDSAKNPTLYITTWGAGVYKSTDWGNTFRQINKGTTSLLVYSITVHNDNVIIGTDYGSYKSTDKGENWIDNNNATSPYKIDGVTGVYTVRDTTWAVLLNGDKRGNQGVFFSYPNNGWREAPVATHPDATVDNGPLFMRDIDMMWKWDNGSDGANGMPSIAGYIASEAKAVFARNNKGTVPIVNIGAIIMDTDSILVWIPDTLSAVRGTTFFDIPIFAKNINKADAFKIAINIPKAYFEDATLPSGTFPIITEGTICEGFIVARDGDFYFNSTSSGTSFPDMTLKFSTDTLTFYAFSPNGKFRSDRDVLFKIRVKVKNDVLYELADSIPRNGGTGLHMDGNTEVTDLYLYSGNIANPSAIGKGGLLKDKTSFYTKSNAVYYIYDRAKFAVPGQPGLDSTAVFWLRREPNKPYNDLPGKLAAGVDLATVLTGANKLRGEAPYTNGAVPSYFYQGNANYITDNPWNPISNTGSSMVISITGNANNVTYPYLTYDGFPELSIRTGDVIGAFYYRNDSLVCGGYAAWTPNIGATFVIWSDDNQTSLKDGFVENEKIYFKIYDSRYKKVWEVDDVTFELGSGSYKASGTARANFMKAKHFATKIIPLVAGWNLISSPIKPRWSEMENIFKPQVATNHLTLVKDKNGLAYWPGINLNQLPYWNIEEAYWVYMYTVETNLAIQGTSIDIAKNSIPLRAGWNLIPYWGTKTTPIATALAELVIADPNILVKSGDNLYWPSAGWNTISNMLPGKGYELHSNKTIPNFMYPKEVQLNIGSMDNSETIPGVSLEKRMVSRYNPTVTPVSQVLAFRFEGYKLKEGDEIGIFTKEAICVGSGKFDNNKNNLIAVLVFGDAPIIEKDKKIGAIESDELIVKLYSKTDGQEYTPTIKNVEWILGSGSGLFFKAGTIASVNVTIKDVMISSLPTEFAIAQNYPNPFNPITNIKYQLPVDGLVKIKVFDMLGREIKTLVNQDQKAGYYTIEWDATNESGIKVATGVYFYQIEASNFKKTMKMMLIK